MIKIIWFFFEQDVQLWHDNAFNSMFERMIAICIPREELVERAVAGKRFRNLIEVDASEAAVGLEHGRPQNPR